MGTIEFQTNQQNKSSRCDNDDAIQYSRWIPISKKSLTALQLQSLTAFVKYYYHSELWLLPTSYTTNGLIISFNIQNNWKNKKISSVFSIMFIIIVLCMHIKNGKILFQNDDQPLSTYQKNCRNWLLSFASMKLDLSLWFRSGGIRIHYTLMCTKLNRLYNQKRAKHFCFAWVFTFEFLCFK